MQDVLQHLTDRKNLWAIGDGENGFSSVPNGFFCYCYTVKIKLNILTLEYTKQICYNAITSKKHSLFTMILYREIRLSKLLAADKNKAAEALGAYQVKKQGEYTLEDYYALPDDQRYELIDGVLYDMAAPAVTHQEIAFEIADVKNQKVIVYDLGDDFGENMDLMIYGMDGEVPVGIYDGECKIDFEEIVNSVVNI